MGGGAPPLAKKRISFNKIIFLRNNQYSEIILRVSDFSVVIAFARALHGAHTVVKNCGVTADTANRGSRRFSAPHYSTNLEKYVKLPSYSLRTVHELA